MSLRRRYSNSVYRCLHCSTGRRAKLPFLHFDSKVPSNLEHRLQIASTTGRTDESEQRVREQPAFFKRTSFENVYHIVMRLYGVGLYPSSSVVDSQLEVSNLHIVIRIIRR